MQEVLAELSDTLAEDDENIYTARHVARDNVFDCSFQARPRIRVEYVYDGSRPTARRLLMNVTCVIGPCHGTSVYKMMLQNKRLTFRR